MACPKTVIIWYISLLGFFNLFADGEIISPSEIANIYIHSDLVVIGQVLSVQSNTIDQNEYLSPDSIRHITTTIKDLYVVKLDSIIKGSFSDSIVTFHSLRYSEHTEKTQFNPIDSQGDSVFRGEAFLISGESSPISIDKKYIICLSSIDDQFVSKLTTEYNTDTLHFFERISHGNDAALSLGIIYSQDNQHIEIESLNYIKDLQIVYNPSKVNNHIKHSFDLIFSNGVSYTINSNSKYLKTNPYRLDNNFERTRSHFKTQKVFEIKEVGNYAISIFTTFSYGQLTPGMEEVKGDLLLWGKKHNKYDLIGFYPALIGGCKYCESHLNLVNGDTLIINSDGGDAGSIYGESQHFTLKDDSLRLTKRIRYSGESPCYVPQDQAKHYDGVTSKVLRIAKYNEKGEIYYREIAFEATRRKGNPVYLTAVNDSIALYKPGIYIDERYEDFIWAWKASTFEKQVPVGNKPIKVACPLKEYIPIFWKTGWYLTAKENFDLRK